MIWLKTVWTRARTQVRRSAAEFELDDELAFHVEMQQQKYIDDGVDPDQARRKAILAFGGVDRYKEEIRDMRWLRSLEDLVADLRYSARALRRTPAFTSIALVTLALAIGANSGLFGLMNALFMRTPPQISDARPLTRILHDGSPDEVSYLEFQDIAKSAKSFQSITGFWPTVFDLSSGGEPLRVKGAHVSNNYFSVLGVRLALGAGGWNAGSDSSTPVVVLSHELWEQRFAADPQILGQRILVNGTPVTVVGVAPVGFVGTEFEHPARLWLPIEMIPQVSPSREAMLQDRNYDVFTLIGRLHANVSTSNARAELAVISERINHSDPNVGTPGYEPIRLIADRLRGWYPITNAQDAVRTIAFAWVITVLVLLISCANLANLLLARTTSRSREIGIRLALGVRRGRLTRLLLTEAMLLAVTGGALGLVASYWAADVFQSELLGDYAHLIGSLEIVPDAKTVAFTGALALFTALLFGLGPALRASRRDITGVLKGDRPKWLRRTRAQGLLVIAQIAMSIVLLVAGALFVRKLRDMNHADLGYQVERVLSISLDLRGRGIDEAQTNEFYDELRQRIERLPGVQAVTAPTSIPLGDYQPFSSTYVPAEIHDPTTTPDVILRSNVFTSNVGAGYFETLGIQIMRGRGIEVQDTRSGARTVVVSKSVAEKFWPGKDPIGKTLIQSGKPGSEAVVVGVVADVRVREVGTPPEPHIYIPAAKADLFTEYVLVRTDAEPEQVAAAVRDQIRQLDPSLPVLNLQTLASRVGKQIQFQRVLSTVIGSFGALAMILASLGLYGVIAFNVKGRLPEIGIRMAFGARSLDVAGVFMRDAGRLVATGIVLGGLLSLPAVVLITVLLTDVRQYHGTTLVAVSAVLAGVAATATLIPVLRATKINPITVIRSD